MEEGQVQVLPQKTVVEKDKDFTGELLLVCNTKHNIQYLG